MMLNSILIATFSCYIFTDYLGRSKPLPYTVGYKFHIHGQPHFQPPLCKGCGSPVETSAFNAEAPTEPAGETVGCRRQLGGIVRLILYDFIKIPQSFFVTKKLQLPRQREPVSNDRKDCPCGRFNFISSSNLPFLP